MQLAPHYVNVNALCCTAFVQHFWISLLTVLCECIATTQVSPHGLGNVCRYGSLNQCTQRMATDFYCMVHPTASASNAYLKVHCTCIAQSMRWSHTYYMTPCRADMRPFVQENVNAVRLQVAKLIHNFHDQRPHLDWRDIAKNVEVSEKKLQSCWVYNNEVPLIYQVFLCLTSFVWLPLYDFLCLTSENNQSLSIYDLYRRVHMWAACATIEFRVHDFTEWSWDVSECNL